MYVPHNYLTLVLEPRDHRLYPRRSRAKISVVLCAVRRTKLFSLIIGSGDDDHVHTTWGSPLYTGIVLDRPYSSMHLVI